MTKFMTQLKATLYNTLDLVLQKLQKMLFQETELENNDLKRMWLLKKCKVKIKMGHRR